MRTAHKSRCDGSWIDQISIDYLILITLLIRVIHFVWVLIVILLGHLRLVRLPLIPFDFGLLSLHFHELLAVFHILVDG